VAKGQAARGGILRRISIDQWRCKFGHPLDLHVATLEQPFIVPLQQHCAEQPSDAGLVWEDDRRRRNFVIQPRYCG